MAFIFLCADMKLEDDAMGNSKKNKTVYTKAQIIKLVAKRVRIRRSLVRKIYEGLEHEIMNLLSGANENEDISLRLFEGITIDSEFLPQKQKLNNLTGETIVTQEKIKAKANITRYYCNKLSNKPEHDSE